MEKTRKTIILELNGLPGSGKTTVSNIVVDSLIKEGYAVENLNKEEKNSLFQKIMFYTRLSIDSIRPSNIKLLIGLIRLFKDIEPFSLKRSKYVLKFYRYYFVYRSRVREGKLDVIICDQGLIQSMMSMAHTEKLGSSRKDIDGIIERAIEKIGDIYFVNCIIEADTAKNRIASRKSGHRRLDEIDDSMELLRALSNQKENLTKIMETVKDKSPLATIDLDMELSPDYNAKKVIEVID